MESHYIINVAKIDSTFNTTPGKHSHAGTFFFRIKCIGSENAKKVFADICEKYEHPKYGVTMAFWDISGKQIDTNCIGQG